jgi:hypothetical protein
MANQEGSLNVKKAIGIFNMLNVFCDAMVASRLIGENLYSTKITIEVNEDILENIKEQLSSVSKNVCLENYLYGGFVFSFKKLKNS